MMGTQFFGLLVAVITIREAAVAADGCPSVCTSCSNRSVSCKFGGLTEMPILESSLRPVNLDLSYNEFDYLDNLTFVPAASYAPYVKTLHLAHNKIEYIRPGSFATLKNLNNLYMKNNLMTEIEDYTFFGSGLEHGLDLSYNRIQNISTKAFAGLSSLYYLFLNNNAGHLNLYRGVFKDLTLLHTLDLSYSSLEIIPPGTFDGLENLNFLGLNDNLLTEIEDFAFSGLDNFDGELRLYNNKIQSMSTHAFAGLSKLSELRLFNNLGLILYSGVFKNLTQLKRLDLSSCALEVIPQGSFESLENLEYLSLGGNFLTEVADFVFSGLENFTGQLVLVHNKIQHLSTNGFAGLGKLSQLKLSDNDFGNGITLYRGVFKDLTRLKQLYLSDCSLETIPSGSFEGLEDLEYLELLGNQFVTLERHYFSNLPNLERLVFYYNDLLTGIGENAFSDLINLRYLFINYNSQLSRIASSAFDGLTKMETLTLDTNKLDGLSAYTVGVLDDLMTFHSLSRLSLHDNPWHCDCDLLPLSKLIQPTHLTEVGATIDAFRNEDDEELYYLPLCNNLDGTSVPELYSNSSLKVGCEAMMYKVSSEAMIGAMIDEATCLLPCTVSRYILVVLTALFRFFLS